jgi:hypothetical protein
MEELKAHGIAYLLVGNENEGAADFRLRNRAWKIVPVMELWNATVYRLE